MEGEGLGKNTIKAAAVRTNYSHFRQTDGTETAFRRKNTALMEQIGSLKSKQPRSVCRSVRESCVGPSVRRSVGLSIKTLRVCL